MCLIPYILNKGNIKVHREEESSSSSLTLVSPTRTVAHFKESSKQFKLFCPVSLLLFFNCCCLYLRAIETTAWIFYGRRLAHRRFHRNFDTTSHEKHLGRQAISWQGPLVYSKFFFVNNSEFVGSHSKFSIFCLQQYHQVLMAFVWILTMIAFIIIFIDVDGWVPETVSQNPHPLLGCITTGWL